MANDITEKLHQEQTNLNISSVQKKKLKAKTAEIVEEIVNEVTTTEDVQTLTDDILEALGEEQVVNKMNKTAKDQLLKKSK